MVLSEVLTINEVCLMWCVSLSAVRYRLDRGSFRFRYTSGGRILIERSSVEAVWGSPRVLLSEVFSTVSVGG